MINLLLILALFNSINAHALCTCERLSLEVEVNRSQSIFEAKIKHISPETIEVEQIHLFKGKFIPKIELGQGSCAPVLKKNQVYIFLLNGHRIESECGEFYPRDRKEIYQKLQVLLKKP